MEASYRKTTLICLMMISCLNKHFARTLILLCWMQSNKKGGITNFRFWASYKHKKLLLRFFFKRHRSFAIMTFVPENFFYLFSTDWNFYDVVIDTPNKTGCCSIYTPVFKNVAIWKYIYNIYIVSCLIKRDMYVCVYIYIYIYIYI